MEFTTDEYKPSIEKVFTTSDGNEYIQSKLKGNYIYLRCLRYYSGVNSKERVSLTVNWIDNTSRATQS